MFDGLGRLGVAEVFGVVFEDDVGQSVAGTGNLIHSIIGIYHVMLRGNLLIQDFRFTIMTDCKIHLQIISNNLICLS